MKHKGVGSVIGIAFLLLIVSTGYSYYTIRNRAASRYISIETDMQERMIKASNEKLMILSVEITPTNGLNLTIKNTGNVLSTLSWIGVENLSKNNIRYYRIDKQLSPKNTETDITNSSISVDQDKEYIIQIMTTYGNQFYFEYPQIDVSDGAYGSMGSYYSGYSVVDFHTATQMGTNSLFGAMKAGPDGLTNILTEENIEGSQVNITLIDNESFEGSWPPWGWSESGRWNRESEQVLDGTFSADFDGSRWGASGNLESPSLNCADVKFIYVDFWYFDNNLDPGDFTLEYYNGISWNYITDLGTETEDVWNNYQQNISDPQYFTPYFKIRWVISSAGNGEKAFIDLVNVFQSSIAQSTDLDLEVLWSDLPSMNNEFLMIYGGTQSSDDLRVDVWNGNIWVNLFSDVQTGWNSVNVSSYLTGATFNIRFTNSATDVTQDSWEIDSLYLNLFN